MAVSLMSYYSNGSQMTTDGGQVWLYDADANAGAGGWLPNPLSLTSQLCREITWWVCSR